MKAVTSIALLAVVGVAFLSAPAVAQVQQRPQTAPSFQGAPLPDNLVGNPNSVGFSLLDPSRLRLSHSYSLSYVSGGYGGSQTIGLYMTSLVYRIATPLTLRLDLGYLHRPSGLLGGTNQSLDGRILPNVRLDYRPSRNFQLSVDVRTMPAYQAGSRGMGPYGYRYGFPTFDDDEWFDGRSASSKSKSR